MIQLRAPELLLIVRQVGRQYFAGVVDDFGPDWDDDLPRFHRVTRQPSVLFYNEPTNPV